LGKIQHARFGLGGYQDCQIGLSLTFSGQGWGCNWFVGAWATSRSEYTKWSEEDRLRDAGQAAMKLVEILNKTKKGDVSQLVGVPVEVTFEGNVLKDWRVLEEVL
jgi:hypothetical protein